jgi:streptogramin lyase
MQLKTLLLATTACIGGVLLQAATFDGAKAQTAPLSGKVSSTEEGMMEGVLVSARKEGSTITQTVVSNGKGEFSFPAGKLDPGAYTITIRAAGYVLSGPKTVDVTASGTTAEVKLAKSKNIASQLSNGEWLLSAPGEDRFKASFLLDCQGCHTLQRVFTGLHTADEWKQVFTRMGRYAPESMPTHPQLIVTGGLRSERPRVAANMMQQAADYLAKVSLANEDRTEYQFKRLPRPKGKATQVLITEYALARKEAMPHDVVVDADGHAWYTDFGHQVVGELDPKTGKVTDYELPLLRAEQPKGSLDLELDPDGNLWIGMSYQGGAAKIDRKTKQVTTYPLNKEWLDPTTQTNMVTPTHMRVDNKVWLSDNATRNHYRLDLATGKWENLGNAKIADRTISGYGNPTDKDNNVYMLEFSNNTIGKRDAKTGEVKIWQTPGGPRTRPRRGRFDDTGRLWFAEYAGNAIGMFDPETDRIKEYKLPVAWSNPYDVVPSKGGAEVWTGSMSNDHVTRLNTKTEEITDYLLPRTTNIRRVFVEETGRRPVLWVGNNHGSAIIRVEPLD